MFDILVDEPKKRLFGCLIIVGLVLELILLLNLVFGFDVIKASSFNDLLNLQNQNDQCFYSYFFFSCLSTGAAYLSFSIVTLLTYIHLLFQALSALDWFLIVAFIFLCISHRSKQSKVTLCILSIYFVCCILGLLGISIFLLQALHTNSATAALARIQMSGIFMIFASALALIGNGYWVIHLVKDYYLKLFKEKEFH